MQTIVQIDIPDTVNEAEAGRLLREAVWELERKLQAQLLAPDLKAFTWREPHIDPEAMKLQDILWHSFRHFYHNDHANAAFHTAPVRYSPITFRLAEAIAATGIEVSNLVMPEVYGVLLDKGVYEEDLGR